MDCVAHRNSERPLTVIELIPSGHNGLPRDLEVGETVWQFMGPTYGCCSWEEVAVSLVGTHTFPFHGVPRSSVATP